MQQKYIDLIKLLGNERAKVAESLSKYSTFRLGGNADLFSQARSTDELVQAITFARELKITYFILGGGTNLLISDNGFRGLVIKNEARNLKVIGIRGKGEGTGSDFKAKAHSYFIEADSGVLVNRLVRFTLEANLSGLEPFLGQPGTVGGAIYINALNIAMNRFFGENVWSGKILTQKSEVKQVDGKYFKFGYDSSS